MSELRVALIAEGPTDRILIEAALKAILSRPFTLAPLQPEPTRPQTGTGWCGVFKWCREFTARSYGCLEEDPTLPGFDLFVVHLDADVAEKRYADCGRAVAGAANSLPLLPCAQLCPPATDTVDELRKRLLAWLGVVQVGPRTALCVPSKAIEAWLAAGVLDATHPLLNGLECNLAVEAGLAALPTVKRIRKRSLEYQKHAPLLTKNWTIVSGLCTQAERFGRDVAAALIGKAVP
jgi:hypothetical protein